VYYLGAKLTNGRAVYLYLGAKLTNGRAVYLYLGAKLTNGRAVYLYLVQYVYLQLLMRLFDSVWESAHYQLKPM